MKKTLLIIGLFIGYVTGVNAQDVFVKKTGVSPSFLTRHGLYYSIEDANSEQAEQIFHSLLFYNDGTFYIGGHEFVNKTNMFKALSDYNNPNHDQKSLDLQDAWGSYYISNDTIYMQRFSYTPGSEFSDKTTGMVAIIKNDSSFQMVKETCDWCGVNEYFGPQGHVYEKAIDYTYFPLNRLPDASLAWFRKKTWFIKGISDQTALANNP